MCQFLIHYACVLSCFSHVWLFAILWAVARQALLFMGSSRQEYWSGLPYHPPGDLPDPEIKLASLMSPALTGGFFQFSSVTQLCLTLSDPMDCSRPGFPVHHWLLELAQTHVHQGGNAIQPSHPLLSSSPPAFNLSQHQSLFQWVSSLHQVAKVLEFQLHHQSSQWIFRTDFL